MLDYDLEAAVYDETRGGLPRAQAAASAVLGLLPTGARTLLDVACGTGLVTRELATNTGPGSAGCGGGGVQVLGVDASVGMARVAARRVGVVVGDGRRLPVRDAAVDAVTTIWLLHLLPDARPLIAEAARVLRPGGVYLTTVDKDAAHEVASDIDDILSAFRRRRPSDAAELVVGEAARHGLRPEGEAGFTGHGQGRTPAAVLRAIARGGYSRQTDASPEQIEEASRRLSALPGQDLPRPAPTYRLLAFRA
ncbi:class I SAM-dependent methyltransferase [Nonomuraea sp. NPDC046570]|uniref:class I SAM-dependent methyltransferase n=1 Tax=Nonomuraea sp. NPDC046570 TaxID=3155255 RepID=UPI0033C87E27